MRSESSFATSAIPRSASSVEPFSFRAVWSRARPKVSTGATKVCSASWSRAWVTLTASGAIYAIRRECFVPLPANTLVEDLVVSMNARKQGYRVLYDPEARATDFAPATVGGEFARRVRIATGSFRALGQLLRGPLDPLTGFAF